MTLVVPGGQWAVQLRRIDGQTCVIVATREGSWVGLCFGGNRGRRWVERHHCDGYEVLVTGPVAWLWGRGQKDRAVDFYEFLNVSQDASRREILAAYAALPVELCESPAARFCRDTLADPDRRAEYDARLTAAERQLRRIDQRIRIAWAVVVIGAGLAIGGLLNL